MKWIRIFCLLGWLSAGVHAADEPRPAGRRFLLIVEASANTAKLGTGVEDAVRGLITGGFAGKIGPGDTLGFWAYAVGLDLRFPMQIWKQDSAVALTDVLVRHVQTLKSDQPPIWENVLPSLQKVVAASDDLTVAIISSPGSRLTLEGELNARIGQVYASAEEDLRKSRLPFVTFLAVRGGKVVDAAVNSGIGPWTIPDPPVQPRPKPQKPAEVTEKRRVKPAEKNDPSPPAFAHSNASQVLAAVAESSHRAEAPAPRPPEPASPAASAPAAVAVVPVEAAPVPTPSGSVQSAQPATPISPQAPAPDVAIPSIRENRAAVEAVPAPSISVPVPEAHPPQATKPAPSRSAEPAAAPIVATTAMPRTGYLAGAAGLLAAAVGLVGWQFSRRKKCLASASLITRSFDRR